MQADGMAYAHIGGRAIHYRREGRAGAPSLMFANSLGTSLGMWDSQVSVLGDQFDILRFDARGHGRSDPGPGPATIWDLALDALAVMDAARIAQVHFVGLSLGGMVAQALAARHPDRLLSVTLCATGPALPPTSVWEARAKMAVEQGMEPFVAISLDRWFTAGFQHAQPGEVARVLAMLPATDPASYAACCRILRDTDLAPDLPSIRMPVLLIAGAQDPATPPAKLAEIAALVPHARSFILKDAAHILNVEQPNAVSAAIRSFVMPSAGVRAL